MVNQRIFAKRGYLEKMLLDISWWMCQVSARATFSGPSYGRFTLCLVVGVNYQVKSIYVFLLNF